MFLGRETAQEKDACTLRKEGLERMFFDGRCSHGTKLSIFYESFSKFSQTTKFWQALPKLGVALRQGYICKKRIMIQVCLNPMERTLYRLFLAHPEGIKADDLVLHWKELCRIYAEESWFDEPSIREDKLESLCAESKKVFYSNVSRIKRKFVKALGPLQADPYIIKNEGGVYRVNINLLEP